MKSLLEPINPDQKRDWAVKINGEIVTNVQSLEIQNPNFGTLYYGKHPNGHDRILFEESKGCGAIITLYTFFKKKLYLSMLMENRLNMGGDAYCAIGGYLNNSNPDIARIMCKKLNFIPQIEQLPGYNVNPNRSLYITSENTGLKCYCGEISSSMLKFDPHNHDLLVFKISIYEKLKFYEFSKLGDYSQDGFLSILEEKLLAKLLQEKRIRIII